MDDFQAVYSEGNPQLYDSSPIPPATIANTFAEYTDARGLALVSQALRTCGVHIELDRYSEWDGGTSEWLITVLISPQAWASFKDKEERAVVEKELAELADSIKISDFNGKGIFHLFEVKFSVIPTSDLNGLTNQGRAHSANLAPIEYEGLLFRSHAEIWLFIALRDTGLPLMPLPVVIFNQPRFKRIEPDFVVICQGMMFVVEVDGKRWHKETPSEAQERLRHLEDEGVRIIRVSAEKCKSSDSAKEEAKRIFSRIERLLKSR
jgi:hypothetical protein